MKNKLYQQLDNKNELYRIILEKYKSFAVFAKKIGCSRELIHQLTTIGEYRNKIAIKKDSKLYKILKELQITQEQFIKYKKTPCKKSETESNILKQKIYNYCPEKIYEYDNFIDMYCDGKVTKIKNSHLQFLEKALEKSEKELITKMLNDFKYKIPEKVKNLKKNKSQILKIDRYNRDLAKNKLSKIISKHGYTNSDFFSVLDTVKEKNIVNCGKRFYNYFCCDDKRNRDSVIRFSMVKEVSYLLDLDEYEAYKLFFKQLGKK